MKRVNILQAAAISAAMLLPATAIADPASGEKLVTQSKRVAKAPARKSAGKSTKWKGYGFLPGYRQPPALTDWRDRSRRDTGRYDRSGRYEQRYWRYGWSGYGQLQYGWGRPGIYRGQWNGGSFGPCWTYTPIGMVWNCGQ